jgi:hypothetical protein
LFVKGILKGHTPSEFDIAFFRGENTEEELKRDGVPLKKKSSPSHCQGEGDKGDRVNKKEILHCDN